jgi:hypothetical protein
MIAVVTQSEYSLAGLAEIWETLRPKSVAVFGRQTLSRRWFHLNCRLAILAAIIAPLVSLAGCAMAKFQKDFWNMDRYRDERAVDIEHRLNKNEPIVKNPF